MAHYGFALDIRRCIGCHTCSVACRIENNLPKGNWWNRALTDGGEDMDTPEGAFPDVSMEYLTVACQHCENPACVKVCPVGATYRDEETGVVRQDYDKCIGCRMCMSACPYTGVRLFNWEEPKYTIDFSIGDTDVPKHQKHVVEKCTMCWHRLAKGEEPACIEVCPERARFWGDLDDPESEVSKLVRDREHKRLLEDRGTNPSVYYLV
ncbi:4Fe-4S dicluster domain-containing protein [Raoultibacter massiliensis]|uniref:4Fe-4S dicluster domain-containing protein n=1 Tax=Raoultibacter massiliensis TaxID=1852371 RepID=UPI003A92ED52